MTFNF